MAKQMVFLRYNFIFDAGNTWSHLSQFDESLAEFFANHDMEAETVRTINGQSGERLMLIKMIRLTPKIQPLKERKGIEVTEKVIQTIKKGGIPLPKVEDKPRIFSTNKGRKLRETYE